MLPRGTGSPARIMCVNCNICFNNNTMRRYHVLELDTRVTSIICNWIHPQIISEDHYVCEACRDLAIRQVNDNLAEASDNQQAGPSHRGHCSVCLLCGSSILRRQSDMILQDNPSDLHLSMIEIIQSRVAPRQRMNRIKEVVDAIDSKLGVQWHRVTLLMEPRPGVTVVLMQTGTPGAFRALVKQEQRNKVRPNPEPLLKFADIRLKTKGRYLGMVCCEDLTAFALARLEEMPKTEQECETAAATLGLKGPDGRSYFYLSKKQTDNEL